MYVLSNYTSDPERLCHRCTLVEGEMEGRLNNPFLHNSTKNAAVFWLEIVDINILFFIITSICSIILIHMYQSDLDKVRNTEAPLIAKSL